MSLRQQLKRATAAEHKLLEERLALTSVTVSLDDYVDYLECTYAYYAAVEPVLRRSEYLATRRMNTVTSSKLEALADDLAFFGKGTPSAPAAVAYVPGQAAIAEALGCSYVLEGAALGGMVLYRHFEQRFGLSRRTGAGFFYGRGPETARRWASFVEALDQTALTSPEERACIEAARATFRSMDRWYAANGWLSPDARRGTCKSTTSNAAE